MRFIVTGGAVRAGVNCMSVGPSVGRSVCLPVRATYGIDEETDKKRPLIDPPCGGY